MIYFAQEKGKPESFIKIGVSNNVDTRMEQLEKEYGFPLDVLGVCGGNYRVEKNIHSYFEEIRMGRKERFRPTPELLNYIERWTRPWNDETRGIAREIDRWDDVLLWGDEVSWLQRLCVHVGLPAHHIESMLGQAARTYAKQVGFEEDHPDDHAGAHPSRKAPQKQKSRPVPEFVMQGGWG